MTAQEACSRHPDLAGTFGLTTHYLSPDNNWRDAVRIDQTFGPLCDECRLEFVRWICQHAEETS